MADADGLTSREAEERLSRYGLNTLPEEGHLLLRLVLRQFKSLFNIILLVAASVTFALGETVDGSFILFFVLIGLSLNVYQEYKSNTAVERLKSFLVPTITVRRDGRDCELPVDRIVPGDILKLESGDIVPADAVVLQARELLVDETTFTGESIPVAKQAVLPTGEAGEENRLLQGVIIVRGNALAEVTATGRSTRLAAIAETASRVQEESELVRGIDRISLFVLRTTIVTLALVILANIIIDGRETDVPRLLVFAIALAVSVIPEALPLVLTFTLSRSALQFARQDVVVKRLSSVQDLGSVNLICTDKTGTITENRLVYANHFLVPGSCFHPLVLARLAALGLEERNPEPFDRAVDEALSLEQRAEVESFEILEEEAFDPVLRSNGVVVQNARGERLHIRRGSPEYFLDLGLVSLDLIGEWLEGEERQGRRVLGVSYDSGEGARFAGLISFVDRLKSTTLEAVAEARRLNVEITVITGDARMVAEAVGREAGLVSDGNEVLEASEFLSLPVGEQHERIRDVRVFARTTPEQKLELVQLLKERYTVGFLGEGINDAPALKAAHVSMVVPSASDVAREVSDIVLLQNDLRVIVEGIRNGRRTHANTLKYIRATLISNFGNFYAVAIGSLFVDFLPMLPKQLLLLNLLSDFPMMAIAFDRVSDREVSRPQRYDFRSLYVMFVTLGLVSTFFDFVYFGLFYRISPGVLQTNWFMASVVTELLLILSIRSLLPIERAGMTAPLIIALSAVAFTLTIALPLIPQTAGFFEFVRPTPSHVGLIVSIAFMYLVASEFVKRLVVRYLKTE